MLIIFPVPIGLIGDGVADGRARGGFTATPVRRAARMIVRLASPMQRNIIRGAVYGVLKDIHLVVKALNRLFADYVICFVLPGLRYVSFIFVFLDCCGSVW